MMIVDALPDPPAYPIKAATSWNSLAPSFPHLWWVRPWLLCRRRQVPRTQPFYRPRRSGRTGRGRSARPDRLPDIGKVNCLRLGDSWAPVTLFTHPELAGERCSQDRRKLFHTW